MDPYARNSKTQGDGPERVKTNEPGPKPKIEKIVTGEVALRKRSYGTRMKETFVGGSGGKGIVQHIFVEVIMPNMKSLVVEAGNEMLERAVFGRDGGSYVQRAALRNVTTGVSQVAYNRFAGQPTATQQSTTIRRPNADPRPTISQEARRNHNFGEIVLASRPEALEVIRQMRGLIAQYDTCSVSDLYNMLGEPSDFTDEAWGWENLDVAGVHRDARRGGYVLNLPRPEPLA